MRSYGMLAMAALVALACLLVCAAGAVLSGETFVADGAGAVYQLPGTRTAPVRPRGLIFLAHGCGHSETDWWPSTPTCPLCIGLPVETTIVSAALDRGFAVIAGVSENRQSKCWGATDVARAVVLIKSFYTLKMRGNFSIPLHLIGASSGGGFVGFLAQSHLIQPKPASLCVQISAIHVVKPQYVAPVMFLVMERDHSMQERVKHIVHGLSRSKVLVAQKKAIGSTFFHDYSRGVISSSVSEKIASALVQGGFVNSAQHLLQDPRSSSWRQAVRDTVPEFVAEEDPLTTDASGVSELMNLAWAQHEITPDYLKEVLDWFEAHTTPVVF